MKNLFVFLFAFCLPTILFSQANPPFYQEIQAFKNKDKKSFPTKGQVLLIGSSSFTKWTDVSEYFPKASVLNRGFGGSSLPDLIRYEEDIIFPYQPKKIIIYCGENDFAADHSLPVDTVVNRFKQLFSDIRMKLPNIPITFISMKPSPSRVPLLPKYMQANMAIRLFLKNEKKTTYLDVYTPMLNPSGYPRSDIFISDSLHMNATGYAIWQKVMKKSVYKK